LKQWSKSEFAPILFFMSIILFLSSINQYQFDYLLFHLGTVKLLNGGNTVLLLPCLVQ
jgi:hypothetical protein